MPRFWKSFRERIPNPYLLTLKAKSIFDIKVFPLEVLDKNDHPTGEILKTQVSFHRYSDGHLCLFYAPAVNPRKFSIVTILTWASTWWWCYNYKKKYGSWPAHEK